MALENEQKEEIGNTNSSSTDWLGVKDGAKNTPVTQSTPETPKKAEGKSIEEHVQNGIKAEGISSQGDVFGNVIENINTEIAKAVSNLKDTSDAAKPNLDNAHYSSSTLQDKINAAKSGQNSGEAGNVSEATTSEEQPSEMSSDSSAQESSSDAAMTTSEEQNLETSSSGSEQSSSDTSGIDTQASDTAAQT